MNSTVFAIVVRTYAYGTVVFDIVSSQLQLLVNGFYRSTTWACLYRGSITSATSMRTEEPPPSIKPIINHWSTQTSTDHYHQRRAKQNRENQLRNVSLLTQFNSIRHQGSRASLYWTHDWLLTRDSGFTNNEKLHQKHLIAVHSQVLEPLIMEINEIHQLFSCLSWIKNERLH